MIVSWTQHATDRFLERLAKLGINYGDVEIAVRQQEFRILQEENEVKTIFQTSGQFLTVIKAETKEYIHIITLWESTPKEIESWKKK